MKRGLCTREMRRCLSVIHMHVHTGHRFLQVKTWDCFLAVRPYIFVPSVLSFKIPGISRWARRNKERIVDDHMCVHMDNALFSLYIIVNVKFTHWVCAPFSSYFMQCEGGSWFIRNRKCRSKLCYELHNAWKHLWVACAEPRMVLHMAALPWTAGEYVQFTTVH